MSISNTELFGSKDHEILWIHNITLHCKITRKLLRNQSVASFPSDDFSYVVAVELERTSNSFFFGKLLGQGKNLLNCKSQIIIIVISIVVSRRCHDCCKSQVIIIF